MNSRDISEEIPDAASIIATFTSPDISDGEKNPFIRISSELCDHHRRQWEAEDQARQSRTDTETLAGIKREIDTMNMRRSGLIDELDEWVADHFPQDHEAPLHTETLGSVVDRLCIAWVRSQKLRLKESGSPALGTPGRGALAARQLAELGTAFDTLVREVASGRRQVPEWRLLKSYG